MSQGKITKKQSEILKYIKEQILKRGFPPAVREICEAVSLKSTSSVHSHLETLEKNGYIRRDPTKPRAIEILDDTFNLTRREMSNVPLLGRVAAGEPILAVENIENYFPIPVDMLPNKETFLFNTNLELTQTNNQIKRTERLIQRDDEIIKLRERIKKASEVRYENGSGTMTDLLIDLNAENIARQNKALHEIEYIMYIHSYNTNKQ